MLRLVAFARFQTSPLDSALLFLPSRPDMPFDRGRSAREGEPTTPVFVFTLDTWPAAMRVNAGWSAGSLGRDALGRGRAVALVLNLAPRK